MKRALIGSIAVALVGCGGPAEVTPPPPTSTTPTRMTAPPTRTESIDVKPLLTGDPCALVPPDLLAGLDVPTEEPESGSDDGSRYCRWKEGGLGWLVVGIEGKVDPVATKYDVLGAEATEVGGFPAIKMAQKPEVLCTLYVNTAPEQGFWLSYSGPDWKPACEGARTVAEHLVTRLRRG